MQGTETFDEARRRLRDAAIAVALDQPSALSPLLKGRLALRPDTVDLAADAAARDAAHDNLLHGWTPTAVLNFAARRLVPAATEYVRDALAATTSCTYSVAWLYDLRRIGARVWWRVGCPHLTQWMRRHDLTRPDGMHLAVGALALLSYLPRTDEPHLPLPRPAPPEVPAGTLVADAKALARIEALLARAAGSDYADEAAACARKAQELMVRHATVPADELTVPLSRLFAENPITTARRLLALLRRGGQLGEVLRAVATRELTGRSA